MGGLRTHAARSRAAGGDIGLFNCLGWSQSGGPWIAATQAMRRVAIAEARVRGPTPVDIVLPPPAEPF